MKRLFPVALLLLLVGTALTDCNDTTTNLTAPPSSTSYQPFQPVGTITGKIVDRCTGVPIRGAVISVGRNGEIYTVASDTSGSFSLDKMPATAFKTADGHQVLTGHYLLTASLVNFNRARADSSTHYRDFYYETVDITFTSLTPGDSTGVSGLVGEVEIMVAQLNTTITGTVVDQNMQPAAAARVVLTADGTTVQHTVTAADGTFTFSHVDNGAEIVIQATSADGTLSGQLGTLNNPFDLQCNVLSYRLDPQVPGEQLVMTPRDQVNPEVILISPENNSDVPLSGLQIVYTFSEPIKQNAYTTPGPGFPNITHDITLTFDGQKKMRQEVPTTIQWDATFTHLTITPQGLAGSALYILDARDALDNLTDQAGNPLVDNPGIIGDLHETLDFSTNGGSTVPGVPTLVRRLIPGIYVPLDFGGGTVGLTWNLDPNARSYNLYRKIGDGPFELLDSNIRSVQDETNINALYTGQLPNPFGPLTVSYQVTGVSKDLVEGPPSAAVTVGDDVQPVVQWNVLQIDSTSAGAKANQVYYVTLSFDEPLATGSVEGTPGTAYVFANTFEPLTTIKADYLGNSGPVWTAFLTVSPLGGLLPNGAARMTLTVANTVTDLKGNGLQTTGNANVYSAFPIVFFESFEAAWSGGAPANWTKHQLVGSTDWNQATAPFVGGQPPAAPDNGLAVAQFRSSSAPLNDQTRIESPAMNFQSLGFTPHLHFYYVNFDGADVVDIQTSIDGGTTWVTVNTLGTTATTAWSEVNINLNAYAGQSSVKIGFRATSDHGTSDIWIDNVRIKP